MSFREARIAAGLTVQQVMKALGVSDATIYFWETGVNTPKTSRLTEIAKLYGTTVDELLKGNEKTA